MIDEVFSSVVSLLFFFLISGVIVYALTLFGIGFPQDRTMTNESLLLAMTNLHLKSLEFIKAVYKSEYIGPKVAAQYSAQVIAYCRDRDWVSEDSTNLTKLGISIAETFIVDCHAEHPGS